mgnify:CR=1 FL=1
MPSELTILPREGCPYQDMDCPKIEDVETELKNVVDDIAAMKRTLYIICGILIAYLGVSII